MSETIEYEQFEQTAQPNGRSQSDLDLGRLREIPMELSVEIGRTHMTVGDTLDLRVGSVVTLERLAGEPVDLLVNGTAIARGEVVVIEEQFGLRVTEILDGPRDEPAEGGLLESAAAPAAEAGAAPADERAGEAALAMDGGASAEASITGEA